MSPMILLNDSFCHAPFNRVFVTKFLVRVLTFEIKATALFRIALFEHQA